MSPRVARVQSIPSKRRLRPAWRAWHLSCFGVGVLAIACGSSADAPPGAGEETVGTSTGARTNGGGAAMSAGGAGVGAAPGTGAVASGGAPPSGGAAGSVTSGGSGGSALPTTGGTGGVASSGTGGVSIAGAGGIAEGGNGGAAAFDAGSDPLRNRVEPGTVCDRFATIQCAGEQYCCDVPGRTFEQCHAAQVAVCRNDVYLDVISQNPVTGYSVDAAEVAFAEFERLASECNPAIAQWASSSTGLRAITLGTIAPGGDCEPPIGFDVPTGAAYAVSCTNSDTTACLPKLLGWTCAPRGQAGADCFTDLNCADGLWCDNPNLSLTGDVCQPRKPDGELCAEPNECASLTCKGGMCVAATVQTAYCLAQ